MKRPKPIENFGFLIHDVARLMRRDFNRKVQDLGLTQAQWQILVRILHMEGARQSQIADVLEMCNQTPLVGMLASVCPPRSPVHSWRSREGCLRGIYEPDCRFMVGRQQRMGACMQVEPVDTKSRRSEIILFFLLAVVIWPFIAVGVVAGWGFIVWMYYLFTGPPGPV